ncbi:MAG: hypothetical protein DWQ19_11375 [Crenarchaeota archaeon]|nr:MAG: hypothetical protein DWQ19_11375 [Thermoproteota archaeon]
MKNDPHNENRGKAIWVRRKYNPILKNLRIKSRSGDNDAAKEIIVQLTNYEQELRNLGYRRTDETEPGRAGRLVAITQEWIDEQKSKETELDRLMKQCRKDHNKAVLKQIFKLMAK